MIHVDVNYSDFYTGLIDVNLGDMQQRITDETRNALKIFLLVQVMRSKKH